MLRIREHSSKALLALISPDDYSSLIHQQIKQLMKQSKETIRQNTLHGRLLQVIQLNFQLSFHGNSVVVKCYFSINEKESSSICFGTQFSFE